MIQSKNQRILRLLCIAGALFFLGAVGLLLSQAGYGIPCVFHLVTGWDCPGCGVTRMLRFILRGDFAAGWRSNPLAFVSAPFLLALLVRLAVGYARDGRQGLSRKENILVWMWIGAFVVFGVLRNTALYPY